MKVVAQAKLWPEKNCRTNLSFSRTMAQQHSFKIGITKHFTYLNRIKYSFTNNFSSKEIMKDITTFLFVVVVICLHTSVNADLGLLHSFPLPQELYITQGPLKYVCL